MHRSAKFVRGALAAGALVLVVAGVVAFALIRSRRIAVSASPDGKTLQFDFGEGVTMELALIPAGEFMMGGPNSEGIRHPEEGPRHRVRITRPFYMGRHEVTQSQYERIMGVNPSHFRGADLPVEQVSWEEATDFCRRLSQRTGRTVRLPTEAEWEYACRAGTTTPFCYGGSLGSEQANFNGESPYGDAPKGVSRKTTTPVGSFEPNAWGLYDMHGNLKEWCFDRWDEDYYKSSPEQDPTGPADGAFRVKRGGCWYDLGVMCRSAHRGVSGQICSNYYIGFRVAVNSALRVASPESALRVAREHLAAQSVDTTRHDMSNPEDIQEIVIQGRRAWRVSWRPKGFSGKGGQLIVIVDESGTCSQGWGE